MTTNRTGSTAPLGEIYVDADACPVKAEIYKVAARHGMAVKVVSNSFLRLPPEPGLELVVVGDSLDAADDWIAERAGRGDVVVTADIPLAARCVKTGAEVIAPDGRVLGEDSIGMALAVRNLKTDLREAGEITGGPKAFSARDRSTFLQALHEAIERLKRAG